MKTKKTKKIGIVALKGGEGKSLVACQLASWFAQGHRPFLIDSDEQETSYEYSKIRAENQRVKQFDCMKLTGIDVRKKVLEMEGKYSIIIIDAGGRHTESLRAVLSVCDAVFIPVTPSSESLWSLSRQLSNSSPKLLDVVIEMKQANPNLKVFSFINRGDVQGNSNQEVAEYLEKLDELEHIDVTLQNRRAYRNSITQGLALNEQKGRYRDLKAINEFEKLYNNVKKKIKVTLNKHHDKVKTKQ